MAVGLGGMEGRGLNSEKLSPRQLSAAVMTGGLSAGAAFAGLADWRWLLACVPVGALAGWLLLRRVGRRPMRPVLQVLYGAWGAVLLAGVLERAAGRVQPAAGGRGSTVWLLVLLALPLFWMGWGKGAAFFRAVEILWLAAGVTVAAVLLLGLPRADWRWAVEPAGGWVRSLSAGWVTLSGGLFVLPYLYKVAGEPGGVHRGLVWLSALGAVSAALALVTAGLLSPRVAAELDGPFFVAAGLLGDSARLEGLVSALWLLPDLVLAGLLSRSWGEGPRPAGAVLAGLALALAGVPGWIPVEGLALGCLVLAAATLVLPPGGDK